MQETAIIVAMGLAAIFAYDMIFVTTWSQRNA